MGHAAERLPTPEAEEAKKSASIEEEEEIEVTSDMIVPGIDDDSMDVKHALEEGEVDEVQETMKDLEQMQASAEADREIKAKIAERHAEGEAAMKRKMEEDRKKAEQEKRSADMKALRGKLADVKAGKTQPAPIPVPPGFEKPAGMSDEFVHELSRAKDLMGAGLLPKGFSQDYEKAYYGVKNARDAVENAGFFKKFRLRRKLKKAMSELDAMEGEIAQAKLDMKSDEASKAKAAELAAMSPEERAAHDKKKKTEEKRWMHRQGMKG